MTVTRHRRRSAASVRPATRRVERHASAADPEAAPAYVRECHACWHVYNGRDEACHTFAKKYDRCVLRGRTIVLCRCRAVTIEVVEFRWDDHTLTFREHRRYIDESPACGDGF